MKLDITALQALAGVASVAGAVGVLASWPWALLVVGVFLLVDVVGDVVIGSR